MRILLINSNTNSQVTQKIVAEARIWAEPTTEITGLNGTFGADIIATRTEAAISQHALLDVCASHGHEADAIIVGMSLDSGVWAAREMLEVPVVGMSEAALHMASLHGNRIGLMVFGGLTQPYLEMVEAYGFGSRMGSIEALGITPQEHMADPGRVEKRIVERCDELAAAGTVDSVILVGAVAAGLPAKLQDQISIPVFEGISCAVLLAQSLVRMGKTTPKMGSFARPSSRKSANLGAALENRLKQS